jgi:hypothetical protein
MNADLNVLRHRIVVGSDGNQYLVLQQTPLDNQVIAKSFETHKTARPNASDHNPLLIPKPQKQDIVNSLDLGDKIEVVTDSVVSPHSPLAKHGKLKLAHKNNQVSFQNSYLNDSKENSLISKSTDPRSTR